MLRAYITSRSVGSRAAEGNAMNRFTLVLVSAFGLGFWGSAGIGALVSSPTVTAEPAPVVINVPEVTIVGSASRPAGATVIDLPAMTVSAKASAKAAHKLSGAPRAMVSRPSTVRVIALSQGGRPGARTVRAWGAL
jgi:hypothetical protein